MKTKVDPRHKKREKLMRSLFSFSFGKAGVENVEDIQPITNNLKIIDKLISQCAPEWPIEQINKIDLAILRLAIHELHQKDNPYKVVIDEAVELAKDYGGEKSSKFVNGVLGASLKQIKGIDES